MATPETPASAARLAELLGDRLPDPATIPDASFALVARARELVEAVVMTDVDEDELAAAADDLAAITERLHGCVRWPA